MNKMGKKFTPTFIPRGWKEEEKGDNENLGNTPVKSSPQGCVLVEKRM